MRPLIEPKVTWDFLVIWQRGRTSATTRALLEALAAAAEAVRRNPKNADDSTMKLT